MSRYFSCFKPKKVQSLPQTYHPPDPISDCPLPTNLEELKQLELEVGRRMSFIMGLANSAYSEYMYCMQRKNLSRALQFQKIYMERSQEAKRLSVRLTEVSKAIDEFTTPPPLQLPPPVLSIRIPSVVGRAPSFRKEFSKPPTPITKH